MPETIVFTGPSTHGATLDGEGVEVRPPAARGDLLAALAGEPRTLVLLDGYFHSTPAVAHKEILYALESGVRVIGAASLGALRAAELHRFGMQGAGLIYRWFRRGLLEGDDEVAVRHLEPEFGFEPATLALVEVRYALRRMLRRGLCTRRQETEVLRRFRSVCFSDRIAGRLRRIASKMLGNDPAELLLGELERFSLKRNDALEAVQLARRSSGESQPRRPSAPATVFFRSWLEESARAPGGARLRDAWNLTQLFHPESPRLVRRLRLRFAAASAARACGLEPKPAEVERAEQQLREIGRRLHGGRLLPPREVQAEAREQVLFERAVELFGDLEQACRLLLDRWRREGEDSRQAVLDLLGTQFGLYPAWFPVRCFVFLPAAVPALEAARAAEEVRHCFQRRFQGNRIAAGDLLEVAVACWDCSPSRVREEAARRGLLEAHGFSSGLREVLEWVAPAERLPEPVNDYPSRKAELKSAPLCHPLGWLGSEGESIFEAHLVE